MSFGEPPEAVKKQEKPLNTTARAFGDFPLSFLLDQVGPLAIH
jgi:hypothetical protein